MLARQAAIISLRCCLVNGIRCLPFGPRHRDNSASLKEARIVKEIYRVESLGA